MKKQFLLALVLMSTFNAISRQNINDLRNPLPQDFKNTISRENYRKQYFINRAWGVFGGQTKPVKINRSKLKPYANLTAENFSRGDLTGVNLAEAILSDANFSQANLTKANLSRIQALNASFMGANLTGAYLVAANLEGALFGMAKLENAVLKWVNLNKGDFRGANFTGANLTGIYSKDANFSGAIFTKAILTGAYISNANFVGSNIIWSQLVTVKDLAEISYKNIKGVKLCPTIKAQGGVNKIMRAALNGESQCVRLMVQKGGYTESNEIDLQAYILSNPTEGLRALSSMIKAKFGSGVTQLLNAGITLSPDIIKNLTGGSVKIDFLNFLPTLNTGLYKAVTSGNEVTALTYIKRFSGLSDTYFVPLEQGGSWKKSTVTNSLDSNNVPILTTAIQHNMPKVVQALLQNGANQNIKGSFSITPVELAFMVGNKEIIMTFFKNKLNTTQLKAVKEIINKIESLQAKNVDGSSASQRIGYLKKLGVVSYEHNPNYSLIGEAIEKNR